MTESEADYFLETACHIDDLSDLNSPTVLEAQKNPEKFCLKVFFDSFFYKDFQVLKGFVR